ncbi:MAG: hypothetical protein ACFFEE_05920 [Candidatus Thorarchaeota archaeon]
MTNTDDTWLEPEEPNYESFYMMLFASVIFIAAILIFTGFPIYDPLGFLVVLLVVFGFGLICSIFNREISRGLGFKGTGRDTPL